MKRCLPPAGGRMVDVCAYAVQRYGRTYGVWEQGGGVASRLSQPAGRSAVAEMLLTTTEQATD